MNRNEHLIWSEFFLIMALSVMIMFLLQQAPLLTFFASTGTYLFGCCAPDLDHPAVQKKIKMGWLGHFTKHRGHWHSILAVLIYGGLLLIPSFLLFSLWQLPVIFGMFGYFSHLLEDDISSIYRGTKRNAIKLW